MRQKRQRKSEPHFYSERLKAKLKNVRTAPVTIVEAPSGYGKTTAVRDFLDAELLRNAAACWFTAVDETPAAGFRRLCREIEKIDSRAGERLLKIELPNAATIGEACDAVRSIECWRDTYLVIDNFQFLNNALAPAFFTALMEHGGEGLHVIIMTQMLSRNFHTTIAGCGFLHVTASDLRLDAGDILSYSELAGLKLTTEEAKHIAEYTEGWIIAVYLQLCAVRDTGAFSDTDILALMERLVWEPLTAEQQVFLMRLSPFETFSVHQACFLNGCGTLPNNMLESLQNPFIRYESSTQTYELHSILYELLKIKRRSREAVFQRECLINAGDYCREEHKTAEAFGFYAQADNYDRMLSLDFSNILLEDIGNMRFTEHALRIALKCPTDIKNKYPLSMLRLAWALLLAGNNEVLETLMEELHSMLRTGSDDALLMGEWVLLKSYQAYPKLDVMTETLKQAETLLGGKSSRVILPSAPWCFGELNPFRMLHTSPGEAENEADALDRYLAVYTRLTNGHGSGGGALFRAWLAYSRGDLSEAEILSYKAAYQAESNKQGIVLLGTAYLLAEIALYKADTAGWGNAVGSFERAASFDAQNNFVTQAAADISRGYLFNQLDMQEHVAAWLKNGDLTEKYLLPLMTGSAMPVYLGNLLRREEYAQLLGKAQAYLSTITTQRPFIDIVISFMMAVGYMSLENRGEAALLIERAVDAALPDGLVSPVAAYSFLLEDLPDRIVKDKYPNSFAKYMKVKEKFASGWEALHTAMLREGLPATLTEREYEVARLASEGHRNSEIAEMLFVSESTVRTHLRAIFQKLDIDRRTKLAEKLK